MMRNRNLFILGLFFTASLYGLMNEYLPGSVAPPRAWFPLRHTDFKTAKKLADSLLIAALKEESVQKNLQANRLEGETSVNKELVESVSGSRIGEMGMVFLNGKKLGEVSLANFHLNWCDFYGALIETEYIPPNRFNIENLYPTALFVYGPLSSSVKGYPLKRIKKVEKKIKLFFLDMDPPPFEFISDMDIAAYDYKVGKNRFLVLVNFFAGKGFTPGALFLLEKSAKTFKVLGKYFIGEKAEIFQAVLEKGDAHPVIHVGTFGDGTEYIVLQYDGKEFKPVYKRKKGEFP
jgi:hypothetical protein